MHTLLSAALLALAPPAVAHPYTVHVEAGQLSHGTVSGLVDIGVEQAMAAVMDCDTVDDWFPDMQGTVVVEVRGEVTRCAGTTDMPWPIPDRTWHVDTHAQLEQVDGVDTWVARFEYVPGTGNLDVLHGEYRMQRAPGGQTNVHYEAFVDLGFWVPGTIVSWATRRILPGILTGLESQNRSAASLAAWRNHEDDGGVRLDGVSL